jgi:hypothetical protein
MFTMFEWMQSLDPAKVERERFTVPPRNEAPLLFQPEPPKVTRAMVAKKEFQANLESITKGLDLNEAQLRAVSNWWKGQE